MSPVTFDLNVSTSTVSSDEADSESTAESSERQSTYDLRKSTYDLPKCHKAIQTEGKLESINEFLQESSTSTCSVSLDMLIRVFGFDPRESPFTLAGYPVLPSMKSSLEQLSLPVVERRDVTFSRFDDGLFEFAGQGTFACVFVATLKGHKGKVAVKDFTNECATLDLIYHEARILRYLGDTGYVPSFVGLLKTQASIVGVSLVQEYFAKGVTLLRLLISKEKLPESTWLKICTELTKGLLCIHSKHVLLNDIKTDNVLVDLESESPKVKYVDTGLATYRRGLCFKGPHLSMDKFRHLAPEVCMGSYSSPLSDVFSLGHVLGQIARKCQNSELLMASEDCKCPLPVDRPSLRDLHRHVGGILAN